MTPLLLAAQLVVGDGILSGLDLSFNLFNMVSGLEDHYVDGPIGLFGFVGWHDGFISLEIFESLYYLLLCV